jgi:pyrroline-5-carboxylate reductase
MAEALAKGLINKGVVTPNQICCTDPVQARRDLFRGFGAAAYDTALEVGFWGGLLGGAWWEGGGV